MICHQDHTRLESMHGIASRRDRSVSVLLADGSAIASDRLHASTRSLAVPVGSRDNEKLLTFRIVTTNLSSELISATRFRKNSTSC